MSIKSLTEEIVESGKASRGEYDPEPGSMPLRVYQFWNANTSHPRERENFCHYWRVVFIWAPLMFFRVKVLEPIGDFVADLLPEPKPKRQYTFEEIVEMRRLERLREEERERLKREGTSLRWVLYRFFKNHGEKVAMALAGLAILSALVGSGIAGGWWVPFGIIGGFILFVALVIGLSMLGEYIKDKAREAESRAFNARWEYFEKHGEFPPEPEPKRANGFVRGLRFVGRKVKAGLMVMGEFFVLAGQAVRVTKWKICPMVNVPSPKES